MPAAHRVAPNQRLSNTGGASQPGRPAINADAHGDRLMLFYRGMTCENVTLKGDNATPITAYVARPSGPGPFPGVVLVHHLPGWSELYIETTRRFAHHGYLAICANLYERAGEGNPDDVAAKVRAEGGVPHSPVVGAPPAAVAGVRDGVVVGGPAAVVAWRRAQADRNGKVVILGSCAGSGEVFVYAWVKKDV